MLVTPFRSSLRDFPRVPGATPKVSLIILSKDGAAALDTLFASLAAVNTYPDYEIVLVDHGSEDDSLARAKAWSDRLPIQIVPCADNYTFSYSNNRAAEGAAGPLLCFLNNDVIFTKDILGRMVAALESLGDGLVGVKQFEEDPAAPGGKGALHHFGIRFRWHRGRRMLIPRHLAPVPEDSEILNKPSSFLAVTGSILMCRKETFLAVGGFHEDYAYAYEDIDLCLKYALVRHLPVVSLNDIEALHKSGSTRKLRRVWRKKSKQRHLKNLQVLDRRFGYALRRFALTERLRDDGAFWGARPTAAVAKGMDGAAPQNPEGWRLWPLKGRFLPLKFRDAFLLLTPTAPFFPPLQARDPALLVASPDNGGDFADFSIGAASGWVGIRDQMVALLETSHRIALKVNPRNEAAAEALAQALRSRGHRVRLDSPSRWSGRHILGDDAAVLLDDSGVYTPLGNQITLRLEDISEAATAAGHLLAHLAAEHAARLAGPADAPLLPRSDLSVPPPDRDDLYF
ncbi:MAG: glycosyltransferase family 2 protein [Magnetospiraceae bacterium]